ncbi:MAG: Uncharacterized protein G01um101449_200 [Parcubacteria group bacterium Gr01-1014_49]|nr:MAG: Uncharacterized protein G01um101449_200 [Parcubacteria group bacterium Gr01-1014_49]
MIKSIVHFFDRLEDKIRISLSHRPILYAFIGGVGIVLFWKGVWEMASLFPFLHGIGSVILGVIILLMTGLLVSFFIGDSIILSGFKREKKLVEKTEKEVRAEQETEELILERLDSIEKKLKHSDAEMLHGAPSNRKET